MDKYLSLENKINHCEILTFDNNFRDIEFEIENQLYLLKNNNIVGNNIQMLKKLKKPTTV
jgi:hypothetical protein